MRMYIQCLWLLVFVMISACAVLSTEVQQEALPELPFEELVRKAASYVGETVLLGGYIIEIENQKDQTRLVAVQAPLNIKQAPKTKDLSQGRLILIYKGFLDPEVYAKGRKITVGGVILGSSQTEESPEPYPYLRLEVKEIHLWPVEKPKRLDPYWDYPWYPFPYPYPWRWWHPHPWYPYW